MSLNEPKYFITGVNFNSAVDNVSWKIRNFVDVLADKDLTEAQRFEFETGSSSEFRLKWQMGLRYSSDSKFCAVYLKLLEENADLPVKVKASLSMAKASGSVWNAGMYQKVLTKEGEIGWNKALEQNESEEFWKDYSDEEKSCTLMLTIEAKQRDGMVNESIGMTTVTSKFEKLFISKMQKHFSSLLNDTPSSDVKIITSDENVLSAHTLVLKARCSVFESMLSPENQFSESRDGIIKIEDVSGKTMEIILHYLYTGKLLPSWRDADTIWKFAYAAGKYQLLEVLEMLDELIGSDKDADSTCSLSLLSLVTKLELKKAESRLVQRIIRRTSTAKTSADIFSVYENN